MEIKFIWREANDTPYDINKPILVQTENNKLIVFKDTKTYINNKEVSHWQRLVEKYKIKYWCYQSAITEYDQLDYEGYWDD
jgi:hypothetical protein